MVANEGTGTDRASDAVARRAAVGARTSECGASNGDAGFRRTTTAVGAAAAGLTAGVAAVARGPEAAGRGVTIVRDKTISSCTLYRACDVRGGGACFAAETDADCAGGKRGRCCTHVRACDVPGSPACRCPGEADSDRAGETDTGGTGSSELEGAGDGSDACDAAATTAAGRAVTAVCRCARDDLVFARSQIGDRQRSNRRSR